MSHKNYICLDCNNLWIYYPSTEMVEFISQSGMYKNVKIRIKLTYAEHTCVHCGSSNIQEVN